MSKKSILIVFPDEWLQYSPSVLNLYKCCEQEYDTKLIYVNNTKFKNDGLVANYSSISISKLMAYITRKTIGYKVYKIIRLFFVLLFTKLFDKKYDTVIAIDSSGYLVTRLFFKHTVYFSLEVEKDTYYRLSQKLGIDTLLIQSKERKEFMIGNDQNITVFYLQNAPILTENSKRYSGIKQKRILYMGNIEFGYGLEHFIDCVNELPNEYTLILKGIKNEKYFIWLHAHYKNIIDSGKLIFDFEYIEQDNIIEYVSQYYIGITGYDLELAKQSFNYFSSPAGKLFNYYAAGVPVIGINILGLKSINDYNTGVLIDAVTPTTIKEAIFEIEKNYDQCATNCIKASEKFNFKKGFDEFIEYTKKKTTKSFSLNRFITKGHERSVKTKQNIITSIFIKGISLVISFLIVPLSLDYLNPTKYGIWLTLNSVIGWFILFDLGLGSGLRNKLAEALAKNDKELAKTYISTSYAIMTVIIAVVFSIFSIVFPFINWSVILNTPPEMGEEIKQLMFIVFAFFCFQFIIKLISVILRADQRSAIAGGINTFASLLSLIIVFVITKTTQSSLLWLSVGISIANVISPLIATWWYFSTDYKHLIPSIKYIKLSITKDLMSLGFLFCIMQFAALILFSTDSFIIAQLYGPEEVTPYTIAFKYFSLITMGFALITTPFWTAYTDAYHKQDFEWIKRITKKLTQFWILLVFVVAGMLLFSNTFYHIWVGNTIHIPFILSLSMAVWVLMASWITIFGNFLTGVGKIRLILYHSLAMIIINIPLSIFLAKTLELGSSGVIIGTCLCVLPQLFLHPIQYKKIITNTAKGIWGK